MNFDNIPPKWDAEGLEPNEDLQTKGFLAGYKPPAAYFNYLFNRITACLKELQTKLSSTDTTLTNKATEIENSHKIKTYVSLADIGLTSGSETIEGIAKNLPNNAELAINVGAESAAIYPQTYGVLHVLKKDTTRVVFKFYNKSQAYEYLGIYDTTTTTKWSGWKYSLVQDDVVDSLTSTSTNMPLSAKQGKVLNESLAAHTALKTNPHAVTKAQVGLGNVPNVATNDQTPTYSDTTTLATLTSGEKLNVAFQKIKLAITTLINHVNNKSNPHSVTKAQVGLGSVDNTADANKSVKYAASAGSATNDSSGNKIVDTYVKNTTLTNHTGNTNNPHSVTKAQVGLGNVPNVSTNDQTPTYSDTTTLATLTSGEKLNVAFQKIKLAITTLINHVNSHKIYTYTSFSEIGVTYGEETIAGIAEGMPSNSELLITIGADNAAIYPQTYGVLHVLKKDATRVVFKFFSKSTAYEYLGIYDSTLTTKWSGWVYSLGKNDVVNNLSSTATDLPLSAKQGNALNSRVATLEGNKINGGTIDFSNSTLADIVAFVGTQTGRAFVGRFKLAADHSPTGVNTWFRGMLASQNVANAENDVSLNILVLTGENKAYVGNIYGLTTFSLRWSKLTQTGDVVDNLLSTVKNVPLSANQGRVLSEKIGSQNVLPYPSSSLAYNIQQMNNELTNHFTYRTINTSNPVTVPSGQNTLLPVFTLDDLEDGLYSITGYVQIPNESANSNVTVRNVTVKTNDIERYSVSIPFSGNSTTVTTLPISGVFRISKDLPLKIYASHSAGKNLTINAARIYIARIKFWNE